MLREVKYFSKVTQLLSVVSTRICTWIAWLLCTISFLISMLKPHATFIITLSSVNQISRPVVPNSLQPHGLQHARPPCPSPTPGVCSNLCPFSFSAVSISSCLPSFPASGSFPMSQFFTSSGQSIGASASISVSPSNEYSGLISFTIGWFDLIAVHGTFKSLSNTTIWSTSSLIHYFASFILLLISSSVFFISIIVLFNNVCFLYLLTFC